MKSRIIRIIDSKVFTALTISAFAGMLAMTVPILFTHESPRKIVRAEDVAQVQSYAPVPEYQSVIVYGDSRGAFLGDGLPLVPGWSPVVNEAREGCAFLGQDRIFRQYGTKHSVGERSTSEQSTGETVVCDTRTYIPSVERYDLAIVYAGTLFTVNNGTTPEVFSPVQVFVNPADTVGQWSYLLHNFTETLGRINADKIVILSTPISTNTWDSLGDPFWDDQDRLMAVNAMLFTAAHRTGAVYLTGFAAWVEAQPKSCQPDGSHLTIDCAIQAGQWIKAALEAPPSMAATASSVAVRVKP